MKKFVIVYSIIFLVLVNTSFFWEQLSGLEFVIGILFLLTFAGTFLLFAIFGLLSLFNKFKKKRFNFGFIVFGLLCLFVTYFPTGFIDFEKHLHGKNMLSLSIEGAANCTTTIHLKSNNRFYRHNICFGNTKDRGDYKIENDTIWFTYDYNKNIEVLNTFAVIERNSNQLIINYRRITNDTIVVPMKVYRNELGI
jgi:hypothetical protein